MGEGLRWFRSYKKSEWKVGWDARREAYASGKGGSYLIQRFDDFSPWPIAHRKCPDEPWEDIGTVVTQEEATALAQAHNDRGPA